MNIVCKIFGHKWGHAWDDSTKWVYACIRQCVRCGELKRFVYVDATPEGEKE